MNQRLPKPANDGTVTSDKPLILWMAEYVFEATILFGEATMMTIARVSGLCAAVFLFSSAASANNECATTKPGDQDWDVQFLIDSTSLYVDLIAKVTDKTDNVGEILMPDLAADSKGWNACYVQTGDESASVQVTYSTKDGTVRFVIDYNLTASGDHYSEGIKVEVQNKETLPYYIAQFSKPSTVILTGG